MISFVIPFYAKDEYRVKNLLGTLSYLHEFYPDAEFIVSEQAGGLDYPAPEFVSKCVYERTDGFAKSEAVNRGVALSKHGKLCIMDADFLYSKEILDVAIEKTVNGNAVRPHDTFSLSVDDSNKIFRFQYLSPAIACGCIFITKDDFILAGGYLFSFTKWGAEDDAFGIQLRKVKVRMEVLQYQPKHMWHPLAERDEKEMEKKEAMKKKLDVSTIAENRKLLLAMMPENF